MWFVYILQCSDGSFYTGSSNSVEKRFKDHKNGKGGRYTRAHKPIKLIYKETLATKSEALKREFQIKGWKRDKKIKYIISNYRNIVIEINQNPNLRKVVDRGSIERSIEFQKPSKSI